MQKYTPQVRHNTLLNVCKTRWIARIDGLDRFEEMFEVIMVSLQSIRDNMGGGWNDDSRHKAASLFSSCSEFSFLLSLVVTKYFLYLLLPLTAGLQERELGIQRAYRNVDLVKKSLKTSRRSINEIHQDLYDRAKVFANFVGVEPSKPRTCRNLNRDSHEVTTVIDYFRVAITIFTFLEHIITEI